MRAGHDVSGGNSTAALEAETITTSGRSRAAMASRMPSFPPRHLGSMVVRAAKRCMHPARKEGKAGGGGFFSRAPIRSASVPPPPVPVSEGSLNNDEGASSITSTEDEEGVVVSL